MRNSCMCDRRSEGGYEGVREDVGYKDVISVNAIQHLPKVLCRTYYTMMIVKFSASLKRKDNPLSRRVPSLF